MSNIYVLKLENDKYYVGKTINVINRLIDHALANGAEWTKIHKPIDIIELVRNVDDFDEDKITKKYMTLYGIDNVRGGSYVTVQLPDYQLKALQTELCTATGTCFKCGGHEHWVSECVLVTNTNNRKLPNNLSPDKSPPDNLLSDYQPTNNLPPDNLSLDNLSSDCQPPNNLPPDNQPPNNPSSNTKSNLEPTHCSRCGRNNHVHTQCYAKTHVKGYYLRK